MSSYAHPDDAFITLEGPTVHFSTIDTVVLSDSTFLDMDEATAAACEPDDQYLECQETPIEEVEVKQEEAIPEPVVVVTAPEPQPEVLPEVVPETVVVVQETELIKLEPDVMEPELELVSAVDTKDRPYQCEVCQKCFSAARNLKEHLRVHTGEKPFACQECDRSFAAARNLKEHMRTHTGERPYSCTICGKRFSKKGNMQTHMNIHLGDRPHVCSVCEKSFAVARNLKEHMRTHTGERPYSCTVCDKSFAAGRNLKEHMRTHTGERPYACSECGKSFIKKGNMQTHKARTHPDTVSSPTTQASTQ